MLDWDLIDRWAAGLHGGGRQGADAKIAKAIGVNRVTVWRYRRGEISPTLATAAALALLTGSPLDSLVDYGWTPRQQVA